MTVEELINELKKYNLDAEVFIEACEFDGHAPVVQLWDDCYGNVMISG